MGRIRTVKPELFDHEELHDAEVESGLPLRLAFIGLWTECDREGRFEWRPKRLKVRVLPFDNLDFSRVLDALATRGFILKYTVAGVEYGCVPSWSDHQAINNKEKDSDLPGPEDADEVVDATGDGETTSNALATREPRVSHAYPELDNLSQGEREYGTGMGKGKGKEQVPVTTREAREAVAAAEDYHRVFDHYRAYKPRAFPSPHAGMKEWKKVRDRFKDGFSVEDLQHAIDGCFASPFHQGENDRQRRYDNLELIVRDADHVQQFIDLYDQRGSPVLSERSMKNQRAAESFMGKFDELGLNDDGE